MKPITVLLLLFMLFPSFAFAGEIYGSIQPPEEGLEVRVNCDRLVQNAFTDKYGLYRLYVPQSGDCLLDVFYKGVWTEKYKFYLYDKPVRYDLIIRPKGDGGYYLDRQ